MKLRSVKNLYLVKQLALKTQLPEVSGKMVSLINKVLLSEGGARAVLFPYNDQKEMILQLWGEAMCPKDIAAKLGLGEDGEEVVLCVIEDRENYKEE